MKKGTLQQQLYLKRRRRKSVEFLGGQCKNCKVVTNLQFDHVEPKDKNFNISSAIAKHMKWELLVKELIKCQLLCKDCHKEKNWSVSGKAQHGSFNMYTVYKCRCDKCRTNWNEGSIKWKKKYKNTLLA